jgi:hypothetical protein
MRCAGVSYTHLLSDYIGLFFRERVFIFAYDTKEKDHQNTPQSDLYSGASPLVQIR